MDLQLFNSLFYQDFCIGPMQIPNIDWKKIEGIEMKEEKDKVEVKIKLPGYDLGDIKTKLDGKTLTVCGVKKEEASQKIDCKSLSLPYEVRKNAKVELNDGTLTYNFIKK